MTRDTDAPTPDDDHARNPVEDRLRDIRARLAEVQAMAQMGDWTLDLVTGELTWSAEVFRLFDIDPASFSATYESFLAAVHPDDREAVHQAYQRSLDTRTPYEFTHRVRRADGRIRWIHEKCVTRFDADGRPLRSQGMAQDVTERTENLIALQESEARFRSIFENANTAIASTDARGQVVSFNEAFRAMMGYSADELKQMNFGDFTHPDDHKLELVFFNEILAGKRDHYRVTKRYIVRGGQIIWVDLSTAAVRDADGAVVNFVGVIHDITERVEAEAARAALEAQLREAQKMQAVGTLAGGIAHDFNNILTVILGHSELLRYDIGNGSPLARSVAEIERAGLRARDLVRQILSFSRRQPVERKRLNLDTVLEESARLLRATLPARIALDVDPGADVPPVFADATQIQQVLINLATNAMQAMQGQPGRIDIRVDAVTLDAGHVAAHPALAALAGELPRRVVRLAVRDTGCGMDAAVLDRIFEPFFTTKPVNEGTGLGLAVVHGIVQAHEGALVVESERGKGSTFTLYLPTSTVADSDAPPGSTADGTAPAGAGCRLLLVDDNDAVLALNARVLERRGYRVSGHTRAVDALAALRADPARFDLVIADYNMPGESGLDLARAVRAIRPALPVVVVSGFIDDRLRAEAAAAGVRELVPKGEPATNLLAAVQRHATAKGPAGAG